MLTLSTSLDREEDRSMQEIIPAKMTAEIDDEAVVFLTGMRINKWWKLHLWLPIVFAAGKMQRDLLREPEHGMLGQHSWIGRTIILVQYWRSYEHLERWARAKSQRHLPAWLEFMKKIGLSGDVGIWHETYRITPGNYETIYTNMPAFGLAKATRAVPITSRIDSARARMDRGGEGEREAA
jgi:hypothetical protein